MIRLNFLIKENKPESSLKRTHSAMVTVLSLKACWLTGFDVALGGYSLQLKHSFKITLNKIIGLEK